jgi:hypothetical protein
VRSSVFSLVLLEFATDNDMIKPSNRKYKYCKLHMRMAVVQCIKFFYCSYCMIHVSIVLYPPSHSACFLHTQAEISVLMAV